VKIQTKEGGEIQGRETDIAWAAGFWEGDGSCNIRKAKGNLSPSYFITAYAVNSNILPLARLQSIFGGKVFKVKLGGWAHKPSFRWLTCARQAVLFLKSIKPYLSFKDEEVSLSLDLQSRIKYQCAMLTVAEIAHRESLYLKVRSLHTKGGAKKWHLPQTQIDWV